jgi:small subunit ribosomal protein S4
MERRAYPPGEHGRDRQFRRDRDSAYAAQLREKQRARRIYGVLERQFRRYYREAVRRKGMTGANLLAILESRLDNVVYRLGLASSRTQARQLISHGHFDVNGQRCNIASALLSPGDVISIHPASRDLTYFRGLGESFSAQNMPPWLSLDPVDMSGRMVEYPTRDQIPLDLNEQLIVEFYSR